MTGEKVEPLTSDEIHSRVVEQLKKYESLNLLERVGLFMGKTQLLEFGLKHLLCGRLACEFDKIEHWPLGRVADELDKSRLRPDFIDVLRSFVKYRNHIAHELLANNAMRKYLSKGDSGRFEVRILERAAYELERLLVLFDWCEENKGWD